VSDDDADADPLQETYQPRIRSATFGS